MHEGKSLLSCLIGDKSLKQNDVEDECMSRNIKFSTVTTNSNKTNILKILAVESNSGDEEEEEEEDEDEECNYNSGEDENESPPLDKKFKYGENIMRNSRNGESKEDLNLANIEDEDKNSSSALNLCTSGENSDSEINGGGQDGEDLSRKIFECDICTMTFSNGANMRRHRMRHTGVKPFECRVCQKRFFRKDHLTDHMGTHSKLLPFRCPICNKGFQRQIAMRAHFQNEHVGGSQETAVKACPLCSFKGTSMKSLRLHFYARHGIDLDNPLPYSSSSTLSQDEINGESGGEERTQDGLPSHFLVPTIEISSNSSYQPTNFTSLFTPDSSFSQSKGYEDTLSISPKSDKSSSSCSNIPSSSSTNLVIVKIEQEAKEEGISEDMQEVPEDLSSSSIQNIVESRSTPNPAPSSLKISPLTSLLREDWKNSSSTTSLTYSALMSSLNRGKRERTDVATPNGTENGISSSESVRSENLSQVHKCVFCRIVFPDITLYFLHKGCHNESNPWKCNICGETCYNVYEFNSHLLSKSHQ